MWTLSYVRKQQNTRPAVPVASPDTQLPTASMDLMEHVGLGAKCPTCRKVVPPLRVAWDIDPMVRPLGETFGQLDPFRPQDYEYGTIYRCCGQIKRVAP